MVIITQTLALQVRVIFSTNLHQAIFKELLDIRTLSALFYTKGAFLTPLGLL